MATDVNGTPYVGYMDGNVSVNNKASVMKYNGSSWVQVGSAGFTADQANYTTIIIAPNGTPYIAYSDFSVLEKASVMKFNGTSWVQVGNAGFSNKVISSLNLAIDGNNTPYIIYGDSAYNPRGTVMKYNGSSWVVIGSNGAIPSYGSSENIKMAFDATNTPYVAFADYTNSGKLSVMKYNGSSWVYVGQGVTPDEAIYASIVIDGNNNIFVAYSDNANSHKASVKKFDGTTWSQVGTAGFTTGYSEYISMAIDGGGTIYVGYTDNPNNVKASVMKYNGSNWLQVGSADFSSSTSQFVRLNLRNGSPIVGYFDGSNSKVTVKQLSCTPVTYYSASNGNLGTLATWGTNTDGGGTHPTDFSSSNQTFTVANGNITALAGDMTISGSGASLVMSGKLNLNGHTLTVPNITNGSTANCFVGSAASGLVLTGALTSSIFFDQTSTASQTLGKLTLNGDAVIGNSICMAADSTPGVLTVNSGTLTTNNGLTLLSNASGTGRIAAVGGAISGYVYVQQYIPGQRGYRLLGHPHTSNRDLVEMGNTFDITGIPGEYTQCTGTNPSLFSYTPGAAPLYVGITSAIGTFPAAAAGSTHGNGILAFVRGAPGEDCLPSGTTPPSAVTMRTYGDVNVGNITETVPAGGWNLIANPYPSQVLLSGVTNIGSIDAIKIVNPAGQVVNTWTNATQYVTASNSTIIPSHGAFLAHTSSGTDVTLTFHESDKTNSAPATNMFKTTSVYPTLTLAVNNGSAMWDDWSLHLEPGAASTATDRSDVGKISNAQFDLYSVTSDNMSLNIDSRDADNIPDGTVIHLGIRSVPQTSYTLTVSDYSLPDNKMVYLHDKYTNTYTLVSNGGSYPFTVDANAASQGTGRMELVFNTINKSTGVSNVAWSAAGVSIVPNPASSIITVNFGTAYAGVKEISIVNMMGQTLEQVNTADNAVTIPVSGLANGVYALKTSVNGRSVTERFVKN